MLPERGRRTVPEIGLSFERIIGFQRRDPLLCESLVELENLWAARDPYRCHREVEKWSRMSLAVREDTM